jgi:hypothetical protein
MNGKSALVGALLAQAMLGTMYWDNQPDLAIKAPGVKIEKN